MLDFDSLSRKQQYVVSQIAIGNDRGHHPRTLESLIRKGMIREDEESRRDQFGTFKVKLYYMPYSVHYHWCQWITPLDDIVLAEIEACSGISPASDTPSQP